MAEKKPTTKTESGIAGGALVVSIDGGDTPRTWRTDMSRLATATFELLAEGETTLLILKTSNDSETIHAYPSKAEAAAGLQSVTAALFAQPQFTALAAPLSAGGGLAQPPRSSVLGRIFRTIFYLLLALVCIAIFTVVAQTRKVENANKSGTGIPMTADQMFGK